MQNFCKAHSSHHILLAKASDKTSLASRVGEIHSTSYWKELQSPFTKSIDTERGE